MFFILKKNYICLCRTGVGDAIAGLSAIVRIQLIIFFLFIKCLMCFLVQCDQILPFLLQTVYYLSIIIRNFSKSSKFNNIFFLFSTTGSFFTKRRVISSMASDELMWEKEIGNSPPGSMRSMWKNGAFEHHVVVAMAAFDGVVRCSHV